MSQDIGIPLNLPYTCHFQERLLTLGQKRRCAARGRQPHGEQRGFRLDPAQHHPQVMKIHLRLGRRRMDPRHEPQAQRPARLGQDLRAALADMIPHRRIRQAHRAVLVDQPGPDAPRGMVLLLGRVQIRLQRGVDRRLERLQPRRHPLRGLPRRRDLRLQRLAHRAPVHTVFVGQRPNRQPVDSMITANRRKLLHPRPHPPAPHLRDQRSRQSGRSSR